MDLPLWLMPSSPASQPAREILELWKDDGELGQTLREYSRKVTNALALGCIVINEKPPPPGRDGSTYVPTIVMQGRAYHKVCGLTASNPRQPHFAQQYVVDPEELELEGVTSIRIGYMKLKQDLSLRKRAAIRRLLNYIHERLERCNRYVNDFKTAYERAKRGQFDEKKLVISADAKPKGEHERRNNVDTGMKEVAVILPDEEVSNRDIVLDPKGGDDNAVYISETNRAYDSLHYTTLFRRGRTHGILP